LFDKERPKGGKRINLTEDEQLQSLQEQVDEMRASIEVEQAEGEKEMKWESKGIAL